MGTIFVSEMLNTFEEMFEVMEMRTFKHEPFFIVGGGGGELIRDTGLGSALACIECMHGE